jgi:hypothetical protein
MIRKMLVTWGGILTITIILLSGCAMDESNFAPDGLSGDLFSFFDFAQGLQGWEAGFAKYPVDEENTLQLESGISAFPSSTEIPGNALRLSGKNPHGNLFYFIKREIDGLKPNTRYQLDFQLQFVVEVLQPARTSTSDVYVKVGGAGIEPVVAAKGNQPDMSDTLNELNIDIGSANLQRAPHAVSIGDITLPGKGESGIFFASNTKELFHSTTDKDGTLWLVVGFDSFSDAWLAFYFDTLYIGYKEI